MLFHLAMLPASAAPLLRVLALGLLLLGVPTRPAAWAAGPQRADTTTLTIRRPAAGQLAALRSDRELQYAPEPAKPATSAWQRFWQRFFSRMQRPVTGTAGSKGWNYVLYAALLVLLVFVILQLLDLDLTAAFGRAPRRLPLAYTAEHENIHELDIPTLLTEAEARGDYRLAVRLGYLGALKQLTDQGLLQWQPDKTNAHFLAELPAGPLRQAFAVVARQFEFAWYGELTLTPAHYELARQSRHELIHQLSRRVA
ncbi:DUF4129 domain-containing protein [Hymenobacter sp. BT175]|uniref:DUF4129 domain-containing protein n=1 Tax=Hymenobacter translucens TaxID=2886507 RepID=UPI001D0DCBDE|nr:DUF4129 domain-containing protein [Hymenobacter translucens]MCC2547071.1 DUF4129 domain-containing protein [Hymenobacter translucens]